MVVVDYSSREVALEDVGLEVPDSPRHQAESVILQPFPQRSAVTLNSLVLVRFPGVPGHSCHRAFARTAGLVDDQRHCLDSARTGHPYGPVTGSGLDLRTSGWLV